ncbi:MAG: hypothetical protein J6X18_05410, partial [Bacteroidales bacterium]|nr:hypothetical protein [Bacteroidales bacterium]
KDFFKGKTVYCNCDDPKESNFFKFFSLNFETYGLKKLITTGYKENGHGVVYIYEGDRNGNRMVDDSEIQVTELQGDGDFRSEECIEFLKEADVVVTNPPFSMFRAYIKQLMDYGKKFLIIGNPNAITYKEIFPYIKNNEMWLGLKSTGTDMLFNVSEDFAAQLVGTKKEGSGYRIVNGEILGRASAIWFTNIDNKKRNQPLDLYKRYKPEEIQVYDNYCAINIDKVADIPVDEELEFYLKDEDIPKWKETYGNDLEIVEHGKVRVKNPVLGVPITVLDKYCPKQFEIVSFRKGEDGKDLVFTRERERQFNRTFVSLYDVDSWDNKKRRRKNQWENHLRENNNKENQIEPIDYFFPIIWQMSGNQRATVEKKLMYARMFVRKLS